MAEEFSFRDIVELAQDVIIVTKAAPLDPPGPLIVYVNPAFTRLTGYSREEAIGQNPRILQGKDTDSTTTHSIREKLERADPVHVAIQNYARDGRSYWLDLSIMPLRNAKGETTHFVAIERDVSLQKALERKLEELAQRDALTGLYNRRKYFEMLDDAWSRYCDTQKPFALITIDIDYFKNVNDTRGHDCGDTVLKTVADRIRAHCRPQDLAARVGGEEFAMIVDDATAEDAIAIAERLRHDVASTSIALASGVIRVTISLGIASADVRDGMPAHLAKRADMALYQSKEHGRNRTTLLDFERVRTCAD